MELHLQKLSEWLSDGKNYFDGERRVYEEEWEKPQWEVTDSVKNILGYECFKAIASYRGQDGRHGSLLKYPFMMVRGNSADCRGLSLKHTILVMSTALRQPGCDKTVFQMSGTWLMMTNEA